MLADLIAQNRSCRRFYQDHPVSVETLKELVDLARLSASGANLQPLKYILSCNPVQNAAVFECLAWAAYLKDWPGPDEGERPSAYIIILGDTAIAKTFGCDHGIAAQSILLGARERGLAGCMLGSVKRRQLGALLTIPSRLEILLVVALGKPKEKAVIDSVTASNDIRYWRDASAVHHVPKRSLDDIILDTYP